MNAELEEVGIIISQNHSFNATVTPQNDKYNNSVVRSGVLEGGLVVIHMAILLVNVNTTHWVYKSMVREREVDWSVATRSRTCLAATKIVQS